MTKTLNTKFWKKYFVVYDYLNELVPYSELLDTLKEKLDIQNGDLILDAGSGTGNLALRIIGKDANVIGFDSSSEGIELHKSKQPGAKIVRGDLTEKLPFKDGYFSKIVSNNTIYTLPKNKHLGIYKELYRVLQPGGRIVVSNLSEGFSPIAIYLSHIRSRIVQVGIVKSVLDVCRLIVPTIKIFYYNHLIKKENASGTYCFVAHDDQLRLLTEAGFRDVSPNVNVYADQAILNTAIK